MEKIKHLHWRAGFGMSPEEWMQRRNWSTNEALEKFFDNAAGAEALQVERSLRARVVEMDQQQRREYQIERQRERVEENLEWIDRMANPEHSALIERMTLFWHGHFACRIYSSELATLQLNMLREHALGNFRDLVLGISRDVSMIRFLNNQQNRRQSPNENFARELMELFTIGRGNYTEKDIKEAARAFTGWSSTAEGEFVFRDYQHDYGVKTFFGKKGTFNGEDIIDMILEKRETAAFITRKIYRYFVNEKGHPEIEQMLADRFYGSGYEIKPLMRAIFESDWFYDKENMGNKIKSPIDLIAGILRETKAAIDPPVILILLQRALGQELFSPPNVSGWPVGKNWVDNSTLNLRLNLMSYLYRSADIPFRPRTNLKATGPSGKIGKIEAVIDWDALLEPVRGLAPKEAADALCEYLLPVPPPMDTSLLAQYAQKTAPENYAQGLAVAIMSLPEYQLC